MADRCRAARIAALTRWSREDGVAGTHRARQAFAARWARLVDPEGLLPPAERARRAEAAKRAHFTRLAALSAKARRLRSEVP